MVIGSPSQSERPNSTAIHAARKARVISAREARLTTNPPRQTTRNAKNAKSPHCPGETQTFPSLTSIMSTRPKLVGLKMCLFFQRKINLLAIVTAAVSAATTIELVLNNRQSERPEIRALLGSNV